MASATAVASSTPVYNSTVTAPLAAMSPTDHGNLIIITNAFGLIVVLIFLIMRVSVRMFISRSYDKDDYLQFAATVRLLILTTRTEYLKRTADLVLGFLYHLFCPHLRNGLERLWHGAGLYRTVQSNTHAKGAALIVSFLSLASRLMSSLQISYVSDFLYLITLWCSKCSMSFVFMRLSPDKRQTQVAKGILVAATIWLVVSIFMIALRCDLSHPWIFVNVTCTNVVCEKCHFQIV